MAIPAVPVIGDLPPAPTRSDGPADFTPKADAMIGALQPLVVQINIALQWMNGRLTDAQAAQAAAAASALAAAGSATTASGYLSDSQAARDAAATSAASAQASAAAAGAAAGQPSLVGNGGKALCAKLDETGVEFKSVDQQVGDILATARIPDATYLPADGRLYLQASYPALYAEVGLISDMTRTSPVAGVLSSSQYWSSVAFGNSKFVAISGAANSLIGSGNNLTSTSSDGINWAAGGGLPVSATWNFVRFLNGEFFATHSRDFSNFGTNTCAKSTNGTSWSSVSLPATRQWGDMAYGNGVYVMLAFGEPGNVSNSAFCATSANGTTWVTRSMPANAPWSSIVFGGGKFVAVGGNVCATSTDGITWTAGTLPAIGAVAIAYGAGKFVITGGGRAYYSFDGLSWVLAFSNAGGNVAGAAIAFGVSSFLIVGTSGSVGSTGFTSATGVTWTQVTLNPSGAWNSVAAGVGKFVSVQQGTSGTTVSAAAVSFPEFWYDSTTMFALPNPSPVAGADSYIKAKVA